MSIALANSPLPSARNSILPSAPVAFFRSDQHRVALGARAQSVAGAVERHVDRLGEFAVAVGEKFDLALGAGCLLPGFHHERIVDAGHRDGVDALGLECSG